MTAGRIDPEIADLIRDRPVPELADRDGLEAFRTQVAGDPGQPSAGVERHAITWETSAGRHRLHLHVPGPADRVRPCLLWLHGGGLVSGSPEAQAPLLDSWAERFDCVVAAPSYRLAPEHPYPAALDDCWAAFRRLLAEAPRLGVATDRIGLGGSSAGGGLAACLALRLRDEGGAQPLFLYLQYPMLDDRQETPSSRLPDLAVWPASANRWAWDAYLRGVDPVPPTAAAARAEDLHGLPPTLVLVGAADGFVDEDVAYARRLAAAGVPTDLLVVAGAPHGFLTAAPESGVAQRAARAVDDWLAAHLAEQH